MKMAENSGSCKSATGKNPEDVVNPVVGHTDEFGGVQRETTRKSARIEQKRLAQSFVGAPDNGASAHTGKKKYHGKVPVESWAAAVKKANDNRSEGSPFWITSDANMILDRSGDILKAHGMNKIAVFIPKQEKVEPADFEDEFDVNAHGRNLSEDLQSDSKAAECEVPTVIVKEEVDLDENSIDLELSSILVTRVESLQLQPHVLGTSSSVGSTKVTQLESVSSMEQNSTQERVAFPHDSPAEEPPTKRKKTEDDSEVEFLKVIGRSKYPSPEFVYITIMKKPGIGKTKELVPTSKFLSQKLMAMPRSFNNGLNLGFSMGRSMVFHDASAVPNRIYQNEQAHKPISQIMSAELTPSYCGGIDMPAYLVRFEGYPMPVWVKSASLRDNGHIGGCYATVMSFREGFLVGMWDVLGRPPLPTKLTICFMSLQPTKPRILLNTG